MGISLGCAGCGGWKVPPSAKKLKNPVPANLNTLLEARSIYMNQCAKCHGVKGDGKRPPGSMYSYDVQPTNFTRKKLMDSMSDGEIFWKITHGHRPMPSFEHRLSPYQRWELVNFLRTFSHAERLTAPQSAKPVPHR